MRQYLIYFAVMWAVHFINTGLGGILNIFGVNKVWGVTLAQLTGDFQVALFLSIPLTILGFFTHPFLHGNWQHIISNSFGYLPLGLLVVSLVGEDFKSFFWWLAVLTGAGTWLLSPPNTIAVGASGVIFGFIGYLLMSSIAKFNFLNVVFAVGAFVLSGNFWGGMFPQNVGQGVSWQGHLAGFIAGGILAFCEFNNVKTISAQQPQQSMFNSGFPFSN